MNIELRHLRYFVAVADELHFGRAARQLHMSQPPLSMQIRALEELVGAPLFDRTQRRVSLTKAGEVMVREARQILQKTQSAVLAARSASRGELGELVVGFVSTADYNVLPPLLRRFRDSAPGVQLTLREATTDVQLEAVAAGRIDVGFVYPPVEHPDLDHRVIHREPLVAALPERHRLARVRGKVSLVDLAEAAFVLFPRPLAPGLYDDIVSFCRRAGFSPRVEQEAVQMQTIVSLVSAEVGVALIPASLENLGRTGVVYKALKEASPLTELALVWRRADPLATLRLFLETAQNGSSVGQSGRRGTKRAGSTR